MYFSSDQQVRVQRRSRYDRGASQTRRKRRRRCLVRKKIFNIYFLIKKINPKKGNFEFFLCRYQWLRFFLLDDAKLQQIHDVSANQIVPQHLSEVSLFFFSLGLQERKASYRRGQEGAHRGAAEARRRAPGSASKGYRAGIADKSDDVINTSS